MNNNKNNLKNTEENFSLSRGERERMRQTIFQYMEMKPVRASVSNKNAGPNFAWFLSMRPAASALAVVLFVSSAGISIAAGNALPGDVLYPIKVSVKEPLSGLLATSKSAKTKWAMNVAGERITEAATLAADGRLNEDTQKDIQINFEKHADVAIDNIEKEAKDAPEFGAETAARFETQLSEYGRILAQIGSAKGIVTHTLALSIRAEQDHATAVRLDAEANLTNSGRGDVGVAALGLRDAAKKQLSASMKRAGDVSAALAPSSEENIAIELESANAAISTGEDLLEKDNVREASGAFREALGAAEKLNVFLKTSAAINKHTGLLIGEPEKAQATSIRMDGRDNQKRSDGAESKVLNAQKPAPRASAAASKSAAIQSESEATVDADIPYDNDQRSHAEIETGSNEEIQKMRNFGESETASPILPISVPVSRLP